MKEWRLGIVGLGAAARTIHVPAIKKLPFVKVIGGHDPENVIDGIPSLPTLNALLELKPDLVVVATPPAPRVAIVKACFAAGAHVFCEKPLANSVAEADEIARAARSSGRELFVNSEFPYMTIHREARKLIGIPEFGALKFLEMRQCFHMTDETEAGWRGMDTQRTFKEFGTHAIDLCITFFGERPSHFDALMPGSRGGMLPDYLNLIRLEFSGDRFAQITLDRLTKGRHQYLETRLVGDHATIETSVGGRASMTFGIRPQGRRPFIATDLAGGGIARLYKGEHSRVIGKEPLDPFPDATARLLSEGMQALELGNRPPNNFDDACKTLSIVYGCYQAAQNR